MSQSGDVLLTPGSPQKGVWWPQSVLCNRHQAIDYLYLMLWVKSLKLCGEIILKKNRYPNLQCDRQMNFWNLAALEDAPLNPASPRKLFRTQIDENNLRYDV